MTSRRSVRVVAALGATFWVAAFFGLVDLLVPIQRLPGFSAAYLLEGGGACSSSSS